MDGGGSRVFAFNNVLHNFAAPLWPSGYTPSQTPPPSIQERLRTRSLSQPQPQTQTQTQSQTQSQTQTQTQSQQQSQSPPSGDLARNASQSLSSPAVYDTARSSGDSTNNGANNGQQMYGPEPQPQPQSESQQQLQLQLELELLTQQQQQQQLQFQIQSELQEGPLQLSLPLPLPLPMPQQQHFESQSYFSNPWQTNGNMTMSVPSNSNVNLNAYVDANQQQRDREETQNLSSDVPSYAPSMTSCVGNGSIMNNGNFGSLNKMLQGTTLEERRKILRCKRCFLCKRFLDALGKCQDCQILLCRQCAYIHTDSIPTRGHFVEPPFCKSSDNVVPKSDTPSTSSSPNSIHLSPRSPLVCDLHHKEIYYYCDDCYLAVCNDCIASSHPMHDIQPLQNVLEERRKRTDRLLSDALCTVSAMQNVMRDANIMKEKVEERYLSVRKDLTGTVKKHIFAIQEQERRLLAKLDKVRLLKGKSLLEQIEELKVVINRLHNCVGVLQKEGDKGSEIGSPETLDKIAVELNNIRSLHVSTIPCEDDLLTFLPPPPVVYKALLTLGSIKSSGCASETEVQGIIPPTAPKGKVSSFVVAVRNYLKEPDFFGAEGLTALMVQPDGLNIRLEIFKQSEALYRISYCPEVDGDHALHVFFRGVSIPRSPFKINVRSYRSYADLGKPLSCFGGEGEDDGLLCRPWGICCNKEGQFLVADRSNNRIQVFDSNGAFVFKFGSQGSNHGQFDRPAGIAADNNSRIIVADKDNHRIQVFTKHGEFLHTFGEKGNKAGQFNYPWDVAVNYVGEILVSDTRNHRIQLFRADGSFVLKYGFDTSSALWKHFDSPRGITFSPEGKIIVSDFNNHRLVVLEGNLREAKFVGGEGTGPKQFLRPQGVAVDSDGNIIVADSRNHRIQILDANGVYITHFGTPGKNVGELDRPSGICVTADRRIAVVDFGNNRIQVF